MNISIKRYKAELRTEWDHFVREAKNGLFLFERNYMDYHADRFTDHSLLFYKDNILLAVLPANEKAGEFQSYGGLTFGGFLLSKRVLITEFEIAFESLIDYLKSHNFQSFRYKSIPFIYHTFPAQEDLYCLFKHGAELVKRDVNSVIDFSEPVTYTKGVKHNLGKAKKSGLEIKQSLDFETFMAIEEEILTVKYQARPVHTPAEMLMLAQRFPENIKLFLVYREAECLGGSIVFYNLKVVHTQYAGFTEAGKKAGGFAFLTDFLIRQNAADKKYFSFGISTTHNHDSLNEGLVFNKESFMARTVVHDTYLLKLA